jgi:hypothetical protein
VKVGHDIAVLARKSVLDNHHVLNVMTHVDPYFKGDNSPVAGANNPKNNMNAAVF